MDKDIRISEIEERCKEEKRKHESHLTLCGLFALFSIIHLIVWGLCTFIGVNGTISMIMKILFFVNLTVDISLFWGDKDHSKHLKPLVKLTKVRNFDGVDEIDEKVLDIIRNYQVENADTEKTTCVDKIGVNFINDIVYKKFTLNERNNLKDLHINNILNYWEDICRGMPNEAKICNSIIGLDGVFSFKTLYDLGDYGDLRSAYIRLVKLTIEYVNSELEINTTDFNKLDKSLTKIYERFCECEEIILNESKKRNDTSKELQEKYEMNKSSDILEHMDNDFDLFKKSIETYCKDDIE